MNNLYRYVGKERDAESGLYYYGARYYAAWTCRFISVDPLANKYMYLSSYNYAANNPINDYDIDGMQNTQSKPDGGSKADTGGAGKAGAGTNTGGGSSNNFKIITNNLQVKQDNTTNTISPSQDAIQTLKDKASGTFEMKQQMKISNQAVKQSIENHAKETISQTPSSNPDYEAGKATRIAYDATDSKAVKGSLLFNLFGATVLQAVGSGIQIAKGAPNIPFNTAPDAPNGRQGSPQSFANPFKGLSFYDQNKLAEKMTGDILSREFPKDQFRILPQQQLKFNDVSGGPKFDFLITDLKGTPVGIVDSKGVSASFTGMQKQFVKGLESATIKGGQFNGIGVDPAKVFVQTYNWNRQSGNFTIGHH